jgi:hypothetical protein
VSSRITGSDQGVVYFDTAGVEATVVSPALTPAPAVVTPASTVIVPSLASPAAVPAPAPVPPEDPYGVYGYGSVPQTSAVVPRRLPPPAAVVAIQYPPAPPKRRVAHVATVVAVLTVGAALVVTGIHGMGARDDVSMTMPPVEVPRPLAPAPSPVAAPRRDPAPAASPAVAPSQVKAPSRRKPRRHARRHWVGDDTTEW